ncbi:MAG: TonB-dependent receptor [Bacteroidia bacterium]
MDKWLFYLIFILTFFHYKIAAQVIISGTVTDLETNQPLPFVHVVAFPSEDGGITDSTGKFSLPVAASADSLKFSHVGYSDLTLFPPFSNVQMIRMQPLPVSINEIVVESFNWKRNRIQSPASIDIIGAQELERYNQVSLVQAVNTMPGVRMEERSPGSYRLSIRGSLLRSPFGVRNVKVYWNGLPFTDAGGTTQLNLIDMNSISRVEVIKGPAASMYGAGTGGVIMLSSSEAPIDQSKFTLRTIAGSYGLLQTYYEIATSTKQSAYSLSYANQKREGYRDHSEVNRKMVNLNSKFYGETNILSINGFYTDHFYEIPGGIDSATFALQPRNARPGSEAQNSSIRNKTLLLGMANDWDISNKLKHEVNFYGTFTDFDHPFILDYKRNSEQGAGGRTALSYRFNLFQLPAEITTGGELQHYFVMAKNYENNSGIRDSLILDDEITSQQYFGFLQLNLDLPAQIYFSGGVSINRWSYRFVRVSDAPLHGNFAQYRDFDPVVSPRLALLKSFTKNHSLHASVSWGFSPPSVVEIRTSEGSLNTDLQAEQGINYEAGIKGNSGKRLDYNLTFFSMQLSNTIVSRTSQTGVVLFNNTGNTLQNGIEFSGGNRFVDTPGQFISFLRLWTSFTYSHFRFSNYRHNENDFSGNRLTGIPQNVAVSGFDIRTRYGLYLNFTHTFTDKIPLNDANTVYSDPYNLLTARMGIKRNILSQKISLDLFGGIDNLLDEKYSLGNDLNAFGGRYYQPAPQRNFYAGITLKLNATN